jgi:hypothetical protein
MQHEVEHGGVEQGPGSLSSACGSRSCNREDSRAYDDPDSEKCQTPRPKGFFETLGRFFGASNQLVDALGPEKGHALKTISAADKPRVAGRPAIRKDETNADQLFLIGVHPRSSAANTFKIYF